MAKAAKLLGGRYMDMMDSMTTVVFEESEDEFGDSSNNMIEDTDDLATSEQFPLLNSSSSPPRQQQQQHQSDIFRRQKDAFPDTPTKNSILERLGSNISQDSTVKTTKSRLNEDSGGGGGGGGVDLLHLDAPVRTF
jgi:hypothetical protein